MALTLSLRAETLLLLDAAVAPADRGWYCQPDTAVRSDAWY